MSYGEFAYIYDELMRDVDYEQWVSFVKEKVTQLPKKSGLRVLDIGCGTGEIAIRLAQEGFEVVGVDLSEDMLTVANHKAMEAGVKVEFYQQNMLDISGFEPFDLIVIFCDSLNYLQTEIEVQKTFANTFQLLKEDGLFLFDVHSVYKIDSIFMNGPFVSVEDKVSFIWNCFSGENPHSVEHELSFFVKNEHNEDYTRFDEFHEQRTFPIETYRNWLGQTGFRVQDICADFTENVQETSERILITAKK
ncbi:class I SAM-dependent methyltransferase [Fredinandcohnia sp. QZ13]|uniref:class I SAM-dependent DNA methyltransferase n=1 Tax=Fredinandcohnia sp. QZ13 TaxID=3073144 RepID=UPI0028533BE8|nr:class I SAM-dependent methyltransferase [Fredinandcohnia sp. QZ13]MDR4889016.1 class I SAM-dependent methyltransferase [Fredinandcohnia sp. QZ13]